MLQRIYGTCWADEKSAQGLPDPPRGSRKRDHRKLGRSSTCSISTTARRFGVLAPKGWTLFQQLIATCARAAARRLCRGQYAGHDGSKHSGSCPATGSTTARTCSRRRPRTSASSACKPMNCPGHVQILPKHGLKSYRDLPLRIAEFGKVHRYEPSGALHGLLRVRHFTQDDAHIFCTEAQIRTNVLSTINDLICRSTATSASTTFSSSCRRGRPSASAATKPGIRPRRLCDCSTACSSAPTGVKTAINPGEGAFYGPKLEFVLRDAIGRDWQCGTTAGRLQPAGTLRRVLHRRQGRTRRR
jgi:threonyl-tRNA synthetase